jgi:phospholipid/cholesterol/gamma-HCH transport system substrate-binding protein
MTPYRKNIMVGAVVLVSMIILGWMILKFGDRPATLFAPPQMTIYFTSERADGVGDGANITFRGVIVGRVTKATRQPDNVHVTIEALVDKEPPLPGNITGEIKTQNLVGSSSNIALALTGPMPQGHLEAGKEYPCRFVGLDLLPPEFAKLADTMNTAITRFNSTKLIEHLDEAVVATKAQIEKAGQTLDSLNSVVGDEKFRANLRQSIENIHTATETANRIGANLEKFSGDLHTISDEAHGAIGDVRKTVTNTDRQITDRLEQISKVLDDLHSITTKIDKGQGTAGLLVNDPKLYESLVDSSRELKTTIADFNRLVEQWEQEGVYFNLGGKKK